MMAWGDDDEQQGDGLTASLVYGSKEEGTEAQPAAPATALPGAQPSAGNFSTGEGYNGNGMTRGATPKQPTPPTYNPSPMPTAPDMQQAKYQQIEQSIAKPAPSRNDAALKPKWYERLAGGLAGGLIGVRNPEQGVQAGSAITGRRYNTAMTDYTNQQANLKNQLSGLRDQRQDASQAFEQQMQLHNAGNADYNAQERAYQGQVMAGDRAAQEQQRLQSLAPGSEQPDDPTNPMGSWHATTVGGQPMKLNSPPASWLNSSQGKQAQEQARREGLVRDNRLTGDEAKYVRVNGKLREPAPVTNVRVPSAEAEKYHDLKAAFKRENGRDPNSQELEGLMQGEHARGGAGRQLAKGDSDKIIKDRDTGFQKAQAKYKADLKDAMSDQDRQEAENDYLDAAETVQRGFEDRIKSKTGNDDLQPYDIRSALKQSLHGGGSPQAQPTTQQAPAPQAQPPQQQPASAPPPSNLPRGNGQKLTDQAIGKKFLDAAGGDKEKARQLATQNGFSL